MKSFPILSYLQNYLKKSSLWFFILLTLIFLMLDKVFLSLVTHSQIAAEIIDIQTPSALYCKLDFLRRYKGKKIVIIGDSVIYGRAMHDEGDNEWRKHTISAFLQQEINHNYKSEDILVVNLGLNGALPKDLEYLVKLIIPLKVDLLICDFTLRSFSRDFETSTASISRPWLQYLMIDKDGQYYQKNSHYSFIQKIEEYFHTFFINYFALYRYRDYIQWLLLNAEPAQAVISLRNSINQMFQKTVPTKEDSLLLALKAKNRYKSINFLKSNPQYQALKRILTCLKKASQKTLIFYATEDQRDILNIVNKERYYELLSEFKKILSEYCSDKIAYLPPIFGLDHNYYIDYVHLNEKGNEFIANQIYKKIHENSWLSGEKN